MTEAQETLRLELAKLRSLLVNLSDPHPITDEHSCSHLVKLIDALQAGFEIAALLDSHEDDPDDITGLGAAYDGEWEAQVVQNRKGHAQSPPARSGHRRGPR